MMFMQNLRDFQNPPYLLTCYATQISKTALTVTVHILLCVLERHADHHASTKFALNIFFSNLKKNLY